MMLGPALMILAGLQVMNSVPFTFLLFYGWLLAVPFGDLFGIQRKRWSEAMRYLGFLPHRTNVWLGMGLGLLFFLAIMLGGYFLQEELFDKASLQALLAKWHFSGDHVIWYMLILMLVNPFLEEMYWRGYVWRKLEGRFRPSTIMLLTSLGYSVYHVLSVISLFAWPFNLIVMIPVFLAGMIWAMMRQLHRSLWGSIISHLLADAGIMGVYALFLA
ncbi:type II CAAX endopeptidase family protein [Brevibacillus sp. SYP-B805]|uniref:CPBP family intramembrane glutamic endopeptidase n=1 Tax=Brevibacillus sp. SYP-B805 TaxID=1578199 RepID=UPI001F497AFF|nr:type II CAAX endopeptidase family protein [Brevibacillus sp. SYP-B805]